MTKEDMLDLYDLYKIFYEKYHKNKNLFFSRQRWSELFSLISKGRSELWRVVGITPNALEIYQSNTFKKNTKGLVRGHIEMRIKTFDIFFNTDHLLNFEQFWKKLKKLDPVVIMTREENKNHEVPKYIKIENPKGLFFSNFGTNWKVSDTDVLLLKKLFKENHATNRSRIK